MREITIDIANLSSPNDIETVLKKEKPIKGDHLRLSGSQQISTLQTFSVMFFIFLYFLQDKREKYAEKVLQNVFGKYRNTNDLEAEIEQESGIKVTLDPLQDPDREDWMRFSLIQLERAYTDPEDDYSDVAVKEPNPDYIPWKKEASSE
jgi:hypothetical protein